MSIIVESRIFHIENQQDYNELLTMIEQADEKLLTNLHQQVQQSTDSLEANTASTENTPQKPKAKPNVESLDKLSQLKRAIEKRLKTPKRSEIDPNAKAIRKLDFTQAPAVVQQVLPKLSRLQQQDASLTALRLSKQTHSEFSKHISLLPNNPQLSCLSLHALRLGDKFCTTLETHLKHHPLNQLKLDHCNLSPSKRWGQTLLLLLPTMGHLHRLDILGAQYHKDGIPYLHRAICQSAITDTNLIEKSTCSIAFNDQQFLEMKQAVTANRQHFDQLMNMMLNHTPLDQISDFIRAHRIILSQTAGAWSKFCGLTPLMIAICSQQPGNVELILSNLTTQQIDTHLNLPVRITEDQPPVKTHQLCQHIKLNQQEIAHLLVTHPGVQHNPNQNQHAGLRQQLTTTTTKVIRLQKQYQDNDTAALASSESASLTTQELSGEQALIVEYIRRSKNEICEHAARRCDLAFLTFVAYYKKNTTIEINDTQMTIGQGSNDGVKTQACHSALISNFLDQSIVIEKPHATRAGTSKVVKSSILDNTQLALSLNMTTELPIVVNKLDSLLEGKIDAPSFYRKQYLDLINQVSRGIITPIQAMAQFFKILEDFFAHEQDWIAHGEALFGETPVIARQLVMDYQCEGSFAGKWNSSLYNNRQYNKYPLEALLFEDYLFSLLALRPKNISRFYLLDPQSQGLMFEQSCLALQNEIFDKHDSTLLNNIDELKAKLQADDFLTSTDKISFADDMTINETDLYYDEIFERIIDANRMDILTDLLQALSKHEHDLGTPLLLYAAEVGNINCISILLEHGIDINADPGGLIFYDDACCSIQITTPLHMAIRSCDLSAAQYLIDHGANTNIHDDDFTSPLHYACEKKSLALVLLLLQNNACPQLRHNESDYNAITFVLSCLMNEHSLSSLCKILVTEEDIFSLPLNRILRMSDPLVQIILVMLKEVQDTSDLADCFNELAEKAHAEKQFQRAIEFLQVVIKFNPDEINACETIGVCYQELAKQRRLNHQQQEPRMLMIGSLVGLLNQVSEQVEAAQETTTLPTPK